METGYSGMVVTLVVVVDGSISLYVSNGGGIIGAGGHESVRRAGTVFLDSAIHFAEEMQPTQSYPLPAKGQVKFYLISSQGIRTATAPENDLGHMRHRLSPLFHKGQDIISAIRTSALSTTRVSRFASCRDFESYGQAPA